MLVLATGARPRKHTYMPASSTRRVAGEEQYIEKRYSYLPIIYDSPISDVGSEYEQVS